MNKTILATTTRIDLLRDYEYDDLKQGRQPMSAQIYESTYEPIGGSDFHSLLQSVYDGTIICDTDGNILDLNERVRQLLRCDHQLIGNNIVSLIFGADITLINEVRENLQGNKFILIQAACVRCDGTMFPTEIAVNHLSLDDQAYFCFFFRDITLRRKAESRMRTGYAAIENAAAGIAVANLEGKFEYANRAIVRMLGLTGIPKALVGKNIHDVLCDHETTDDIVKSVQAFQTWEKELNCEIGDHQKVVLRASIAPNIDSDGDVIGMVISLLDITETKMASLKLESAMRELKRSNQDLEQFAYAVSHDLQAPLRKMSMFVKMIKDVETDALQPETNDILGRIQHASNSMTELINCLLDYSRVTSGMARHKPVALDDILTEVLSDLEVTLLETDGVVSVGELPTIMADPSQMRQLFQNLVGNALKFHRPGVAPRVEISSEPLVAQGESATTRWQISVKDNGIGFSPKDAERIFGVFQRLHPSGEYEGSGVGLAICRKIIERHNGELSATGNPGEGSVFRVVLPASNEM